MLDTKITILGCGQMGIACAGILQEGGVGGGGIGQGAGIRMWAHSAGEADELNTARGSERLPGVELAAGVRATTDLDEAIAWAGGDGLVLNAVPVQFMRGVWERVDPGVLGGAGVATVSKGLEVGTRLLPTGIMESALGGAPGGGVCAVGGPAIAKEIAQRLPAIMLAASEDPALAERVQGLFTAELVRTYTGSDVVGVEVAGALKNVIALASGILDGMGMGYNAKSALLARGLAELVRIGVAMGARMETFFGVAGVGDLATTCFSPVGRNRSFGEALVKGETLEQFNARTGCVVEGAATVQAAVEIAKELGVEAPIAEGVHSVLYGGVDPREALEALMSREMKEERVG